MVVRADRYCLSVECSFAANFVLKSVVFNAERVVLSKVQVLAPMVLKLRPKPMPAKIGYSLRR